jgi:phosphoribosylformimino-5-aminoimidazole carboxamide ribotide isomerase
MIIYPAIDILNKRSVRLFKGNYDKVTDYGQPSDIVELFYKSGARYLHIVDLNGAKQETVNLDTIKMLLDQDIFIELGGGIRSLEQAENYLKLGVNQIIIGTAAVKNPDLLSQLIDKYPDNLTVGIDAINGMVAVEGWTDISSISADEFILQLETLGVKRVIYTDISRDGTLQGPNFDMYKRVINMSRIEIVASGGISCIEDLKKLKEIGLPGVVVGKALYEKKFTLEEAILC